MFPLRPSVIVGAAGRLSPEKGFRILVDAAAELLGSEQGAVGSELASSAPIGFVLFGDGPLRARWSPNTGRGLQGRFHIAGFHTDLDKYYPHLDLLALPSYTEGLPNVVLEAFAADVPVVATAVGGTPEAVLHGINGYLVEAGDVRALAGRIADMLSDPARRREMAANGQRYIRQDSPSPGRQKTTGSLLRALILTPHDCLAARQIRAKRHTARRPSRPVRVCFMIDKLFPAGIELQLLMLIKQLDRSRVEPSLCLLDGCDELTRSLEPKDCPVIRLGVRHSGPSVVDRARLPTGEVFSP